MRECIGVEMFGQEGAQFLRHPLDPATVPRLEGIHTEKLFERTEHEEEWLNAHKE